MLRQAQRAPRYLADALALAADALALPAGTALGTALLTALVSAGPAAFLAAALAVALAAPGEQRACRGPPGKVIALLLLCSSRMRMYVVYD